MDSFSMFLQVEDFMSDWDELTLAEQRAIYEELENMEAEAFG